MTWTQGQPSRANQSPFIDPEKEPRNGRMAPNYTKGNDRRNDPNQKYNPNTARTPHTRSEQPVAATFTQEGLQTFSLIFSSAVEAAIAKSLPSLVEQAVRRELDTAIREIRSDIGQTINGFLTDLVHHAQTSIEKRIDEIIDANIKVSREQGMAIQAEEFPSAIENLSSADSVPSAERVTSEETVSTAAELPAAEAVAESAPLTITRDVSATLEVPATLEAPMTRLATTAVDEETRNTTEPERAMILDDTEDTSSRSESQPIRRTAREMDIVLSTLKELGRPVRTNELEDLMGTVAWGTNPSIKMSYFMNRSEGQIERVGRGLYQYKQQA